MLPYHDQDWMTNYPLYCVNFIYGVRLGLL